MRKKRVAFFDFSCCEGCQLQVANMGEALIDVLDYMDIVEFRDVTVRKKRQLRHSYCGRQHYDRARCGKVKKHKRAGKDRDRLWFLRGHRRCERDEEQL